jgi:hypothetical protein
LLIGGPEIRIRPGYYLRCIPVNKKYFKLTYNNW